MRRQWLFAGVLGVVVVIAVIVGAFALGILPLSGDASVEPALGPGRIAFVSDGDGDDEIYVMNADGSGVVQLTDNDSDDLDPAWSPDGGRIAFVSDRDNGEEIYDIYVMNADGSGVEQLTDDCSNGQLAWSPDGDRIAFGSRTDIYVMNADGGGKEQLTGDPQYSCAELFLSDRDGEPAWYVRRADGSVELATDYHFGHIGNGGPVWSPDGGRIAFHSGRGGDGIGVYVMNADGSGVERLVDTDHVFALDGDVAWAPDSGRIAFVSNRGGDGTGFNFDDQTIYVMDDDGTGVERLTDHDHLNSGPAWSPDSNRIAFTSHREGGNEIYVVNADGSGAVRLADGQSAEWSPLLD